MLHTTAAGSGPSPLPAASAFEKAKGSPLMGFYDKTLTCSECAGSFVFTAAEQELLLLLRGRSDEPSRCPRCCRRPSQRPSFFDRSSSAGRAPIEP